jgi:hypothetical protein
VTSALEKKTQRFFFRENLPGYSGSAFLEILVLRAGKVGALIIWVGHKAAYVR